MFQTKRRKNLNLKKKEIKEFNSLIEIIDDIKSNCTAKFTESIDLCVGLRVNPKKSDENIRSSFVLPHGIQKKVKIAAFAPSMIQDEIKKAGADVVGLEDLVEMIKKNEKVDFDVCFATIDALPKIVSIAKILGQAGVMPNKKDGTVTNDIIQAIKEVKEGKKCVFRNDSAGYVHLSVGKSDISSEKIAENISEIVNYILTLKPPKVKEMIKQIVVSSTMGIGRKIPLKFLLKK